MQTWRSGSLEVDFDDKSLGIRRIRRVGADIAQAVDELLPLWTVELRAGTEKQTVASDRAGPVRYNVQGGQWCQLSGSTNRENCLSYVCEPRKQKAGQF